MTRSTTLSIALLLLMISPLLGGCISKFPVDLALTSVRAVDWRDQDEIPGPGASLLLGMLPMRDLALMGESVTGGEKSPRLVLKIEFVSAMNLSKFVIENDYTLGSYAHICDRPFDATVGMTYPTVYWQRQRLNQHEADPIQQQRTVAGELVNYYFFINVARVGAPRVGEEDFDLLRKPEDICFAVRGGNNTGFGYRSNTVIIPKDVIAEALRNRPRLFPSRVRVDF